MAYPSLEFFRQFTRPEISGYALRTIKTSAPPAKVEEVSLYSDSSGDSACRLIAKIISPDWPDDPHGQDRERFFYQRVFPRLGFEHPRVYFAGMNPGTRERLILMEDLSSRYRFPLPDHRWNSNEVFCFLRAYARLHSWGREILPAIEDRAWLLTYERKPLECEQIAASSHYLVSQGIWHPLPNLERLIQRTQEQLCVASSYPVTLIHNDLYPPNIGLPRNLADPAVLIDWDMAAWGWAEIDLAYLFMQPFCSASRIDRQEALDYYWDQRLALEGRIPSRDERQPLQNLADSLFALAEVLVAAEVARKPYPPGSAPGAYWEAMYAVLYQRLVQLCERI
jgi:hypothetical protein